MKSFIIISAFIISPFLRLKGQDNLSVLKHQLDSLAQEDSSLNKNISFHVSGMPLPEFLLMLGKSNELNISVDPVINDKVTYSFSHTDVKSVFLFICRQYDLWIEMAGNIFSFYKSGRGGPPVPETKEPVIEYSNGYLKLDLDRDSLRHVIRRISQLTELNLLPSSQTEGLISGYIHSLPPGEALRLILEGNGYGLKKMSAGTYIISENNLKTPSVAANGMHDFSFRSLTDSSGAYLNIEAENMPIEKIVRDISDYLSVSYHILCRLEGNATFVMRRIGYEELLRNLFRGTNYCFSEQNGHFLIGERDERGMQKTVLIRFEKRPVAGIEEVIPASLKKNIELDILDELNALLIRGTQEEIRDMEAFARLIDEHVPQVIIKMLVLDVNIARVSATGISAGIKNPGDTLVLPKILFPGIDFGVGKNDINWLIDKINSFSFFNLGKLDADFFLHLQAEETKGNLKIKSTPMIATLNGHEASMQIGQTQYFLLKSQTTIPGNQPVIQETERFEKIEANITLKIKPFITNRNEITLEIHPDFTTPVGTLKPDVPPTISSRKFDSIVRMRNGETIVLGGLVEEKTDHSYTGTPLLSRIPLIGYFFRSSTDRRMKNRLIIYLTPEIRYD